MTETVNITVGELSDRLRSEGATEASVNAALLVIARLLEGGATKIGAKHIGHMVVIFDASGEKEDAPT